MTTTDTLSGKLSSILKHAHDQGIADTLSLFVGFDSADSPRDVTLHQGHGSAQESIYDLASLTKIIGTTAAVAIAIADGHMSLQETPFTWWPGITIEMLLAHQAGLPAHRKFCEELSLSSRDFQKNRKLVFDELFSLKTLPSTERLYSDLGFMALGYLLEQRLKKPLFRIFQEAWHALGIAENFVWYPSRAPFFVSTDSSVVPTGFCHYRKTRVLGQVHDPNCYYLGGLAGHAGLFGRLDSVKNVGQFLLGAVKNKSHQTQSMLARFARVGLGFDKPNAKGSTQHLFPSAFGHFGYTGTSLWIDPTRSVIIALLTNRVNSSDRPEGIYKLRLTVHKTIVQFIDQQSPNTVA